MAGMIDGHIHFLMRDDEERRMVEAMDANGVERSVLFPLPNMRFRDARCGGNEEVFDLCARRPDRFSPVVYADPREATAVDTVRRYAERGAKACKIFPPVGYYPDDDICMELYETLAELSLPLVSHTGYTSMPYEGSPHRQSTSSHWADPIRFDGLARKFPEVRWVLAHMGMPWCQNAWFVANVNPNVYLDVAGGTLWMPMVPILWRQSGGVFGIDFDRVIWGSDNCGGTLDQQLAFSRGLIKELGCDEAHVPAVFGQTVRKLLDLP